MIVESPVRADQLRPLIEPVSRLLPPASENASATLKLLVQNAFRELRAARSNKTPEDLEALKRELAQRLLGWWTPKLDVLKGPAAYATQIWGTPAIEVTDNRYQAVSLRRTNDLAPVYILRCVQPYALGELTLPTGRSQQTTLSILTKPTRPGDGRIRWTVSLESHGSIPSISRLSREKFDSAGVRKSSVSFGLPATNTT